MRGPLFFQFVNAALLVVTTLGLSLSSRAASELKIPTHLMAEDGQTLPFLKWQSPTKLASLDAPSFLLTQKREIAAVTVDDANKMIFAEISVPKARLKKLEQYRLALSQSSQNACPELQKLAEDADFNRRDFAKLRFWILCSSSVKPEDNLHDINITAIPFAQGLKDEAEMVVGARLEKWDRYLELQFAKIRASRNVREKTQWLKSGLQIAETKGRPVEAARYRKELERLAPRLIQNPKPGDFLEVGQDWISVREFEKGRGYLQKVMKSKLAQFQDQRQAFQSIRNSYKVEQKKEQHIAESAKYYQWLITNREWALAFDSGLYWVRALWTDGQKAKAQAEMIRMEKFFEGRGGRVHELEFIRGRMAEEDAAFAKSLVHYEKALTKGAQGTSQQVKIEASRAWVLRRLGRDVEAAAAFATLGATAKEPGDQLRALFWQGKSLARAGQTEKAQAVFKQVAYDDPVGYYGLIAFHELKAAIPPLNSSREESLKGWNALRFELDQQKQAALLEDDIADASRPVSEDTATKDPKLLLDAAVAQTAPIKAAVEKALRVLSLDEKVWITDLHLLGEKKVLQTYLDSLANESGWDYTTPEGFELLKSYARAGLYLPLFATIGKIEKVQREALLRSHPELLFPLDFQDAIRNSAARQEIPPELVFSIIRQESAFDPNARSWADAMGLMQILPTQAKVVAKELGIPFTGHDDLFKPELNIPVGAKMLRQGLNRYDGNFILAIASYNANDRAIKGWLKSRFREDPVEFIEEIAYEETRTYVKLVLRNYIFYKRLKNPETTLSFPSECLPDLQKFKPSAGDEVVSR